MIENKNEYSGVAAAVKAVIRSIVPLTPRMLANSICMLKSADSFVHYPDINTPAEWWHKCGVTRCEPVRKLESWWLLSTAGAGRHEYAYARHTPSSLFYVPSYSILTWYCCSLAEQISLLNTPSVEVTRRHSPSSETCTLGHVDQPWRSFLRSIWQAI